MTPEEAVKALDALHGSEYGDTEYAHIAADKILLEAVPPEVAEAYARLEERCDGFWYA